MKILIVDDSLMDRKLLMSVLKKSGVTQEMVEARNGEEGLSLLGEQYKDICLILLDWQMPVVDGIAFMEAFRKVPHVAHIPIVMITASASQQNKDLARSVNPDLAGYLVKPYNPDVLMSMVRSHLK